MTDQIQQLRERTVEASAATCPKPPCPIPCTSCVNRDLASDWQSAYDRDMAAKDAEIAMLREALKEAMEWNWIDDTRDIPQFVTDMCDEALAKTEAAE